MVLGWNWHGDGVDLKTITQGGEIRLDQSRQECSGAAATAGAVLGTGPLGDVRGMYPGELEAIGWQATMTTQRQQTG